MSEKPDNKTMLLDKKTIVLDDNNVQSEDKTVAKTLWSDTLIDMLIVALNKNATDEQLKDIIKDLNHKGYKNYYLEDKVTREIGEDAARRIRRLTQK